MIQGVLPETIFFFWVVGFLNPPPPSWFMCLHITCAVVSIPNWHELSIDSNPIYRDWLQMCVQGNYNHRNHGWFLVSPVRVSKSVLSTWASIRCQNSTQSVLKYFSPWNDWIYPTISDDKSRDWKVSGSYKGTTIFWKQLAFTEFTLPCLVCMMIEILANIFLPFTFFIGICYKVPKIGVSTITVFVGLKVFAMPVALLDMGIKLNKSSSISA